MIAFEVPDMTCGHCVSAITKALKEADPAAQVRIDLGVHRVEVEPAQATQADLASAMAEAGYNPKPLA